MKTFFIALRTFAYTIGGVIFFIWAVLWVRTLDRGLEISWPMWMAIPGILLTMVGGFLILLCFGVFVIWGRGTPLVVDPPKEFVARGPYRYVRNPIYLGQILLLIGLGLYLRSVSVLILAFVWFLFVHLFVVYVEEPGLTERFGATYEAYRRAVPRWIPSTRAKRNR